MIVNINSKLFLEILEEDDKRASVEESTAGDLLILSEDLRKNLNDLQDRIPNAQRVLFDTEILALRNDLDHLMNKRKGIEKTHDKTEDGRRGLWPFRNRQERMKNRTVDNTTDFNQLNIKFANLDDKIYEETGVVSLRRANIMYKELQNAGKTNPNLLLDRNTQNALTTELQRNGKTVNRSSGILQNMNNTLNHYANQGSEAISKHTNATPEQAKAITTGLKRVAIYFAAKAWRNLDGLQDKAIAIGGGLALWAMLFGDGAAHDKVNEFLNSQGILGGSNSTSSSNKAIEQFGLSGTDYETFKKGKNSNEMLMGLTSKIAGDEAAKTKFLNDYLKHDGTSYSLNSDKLLSDAGIKPKNDNKNRIFIEKLDPEDIQPALACLAYLEARVNQDGSDVLLNQELDKYYNTINLDPKNISISEIRSKEANKKASIEREAIENQKKNIDQALLGLGLTIKKGVSPAEVEKVINSSNFADLSNIMKIKKLEKVTELTKKTADVGSIEYTAAMKELEATSTLKDQVVNKEAFVSGFVEVKTLADYLYPRDKFVLIQKNGELYIQHRGFKLKVEVDGASLYLKAKGRTSEFQLSGSSDPKALAYDALIILNSLNSYVRKLDISDEKAKEVDTEFPFRGDEDRGLSFYQATSGIVENIKRVGGMIYKDCEEESYLINNNLTGVASSYKGNTKKLAAELNNLKDGSSQNKSIFRIGSDIPQSMVAEGVKLDGTYNSPTGVDGGFETSTTTGRHKGSRENIKNMVKGIPESIANGITGTVDYLVSAEPGKEGIVTKIMYTAGNTVTTLVEKGGKRAYETTKDASQTLATDLVSGVDRAKQNILGRETNFDTYLKGKAEKTASPELNTMSDADYICKSIINFSATEPLFYSVYHNRKYQNQANTKGFWDIAGEIRSNPEYAPIISLLKNDGVILGKIKAKGYNTSKLDGILQGQDDASEVPMLTQLCFKYLENNGPLVISEGLGSKLFGQLQGLMPENGFTRKGIVESIVGGTMSGLGEVINEIKNHPNGKSIIGLLELRLGSKVVKGIFS